MYDEFGLEVAPGRMREVVKALRPVLLDAWHLPNFSEVLGTDVLGLRTELGVTSEQIRGIPGVITAEGTADHIFYSGLPEMGEATAPGIGSMTDDDIYLIRRPLTSRASIHPGVPPGVPTLFAPEVSEGDFHQAGAMDRILDLIGAKRAWRHNRGESSIIAVLDSGVDGARIGADQLAGTWVGSPGLDPLVDDTGHGTMVALIAASRGEVNGFDGVAPDADLYVLKPDTDERGVMSTISIMRGMDHLMGVAKDHNRSVIMNNSWGLWGCKSLLLPCRIIITRVMVRMDVAGVCCPSTVWALGNNHLLGCGSEVDGWCMNSGPASFSVGAVSLGLQLQPYSSVGGQCYPLSPMVCCPTGGILPWGKGFKDFGPYGGGTSSCAPQVSGAVAILAAANPGITNSEMRAAMRQSALQLGPDTMFNPGFGSGLLQVDKAIEAAPFAKTHVTFTYEEEFLRRFRY